MNRPHSSVTAFVALERALESGENKARSALEHKPPSSSNGLKSEQDKEPEQEAVLEVVGPGPSEESGNDATKWSERKEAVVDLTKLASTKRISPADFSEVCRTLKKPPRFDCREAAERVATPGVTIGLVWTAFGGEV
ncbi:hypothetical protein JHK87_039478 [Glycine soja]|nr:hypothetical protein JHK87_039478 [Glycine soja]